MESTTQKNIFTKILVCDRKNLVKKPRNHKIRELRKEASSETSEESKYRFEADMSPGEFDEEIEEEIAQVEDKQLSILELDVSEESEADVIGVDIGKPSFGGTH